MNSQSSLTADLQKAIAAAVAGRYEEAETRCQRILADRPDDPAALTLMGALRAQRGAVREAVAHYRAALAAAPRFVKALNNLGAALSGLGELDEAERHLTLALEIEPDNAAGLINLGQIHLRRRRAAEAIALLERATALAPDDAMAWNNLGAALLQAERSDDAIVAFRKALERDPSYVAVWNNIGNAHHRAGRYVDAAAAFRAAIEGGAATAESWSHLGVALRGMDRAAEALAAADRAVTLAPALAEARFDRALLLLALGRFAEGWADYRFRPSARAFRAGQAPADFAPLPQDLRGKTVFVAGNLGFGDELFFLRFASELKRRGAAVLYRAGGKIASLVRRFGALDQVLDRQASDQGEAPSADVTLLVDDLPFALGASDTPPAWPLAPDAARRAALQARLAAFGPPPYLGVTWRAGVKDVGRLFKTLPMERLARAAAVWPGTIVALQRQPQFGEIATFADIAGRPVQDSSALNDDLEEMLALLSLLDDYVAVSNTNVHLRQSLGRASRVLVPLPADWRWMAAGDESPWFSGCPIYRETADDGWEGALARLAADLSSARDARA